MGRKTAAVDLGCRAPLAPRQSEAATGALRRNHIRGTIVIFALVILAVAAIGLAGGVYMMGALMEHTVATQNAVQRRLALENSKALAAQFFREKTMQGGLTTGYTNTAVDYGGNYLGGIAIEAPGASVWTSGTTTSGANHFSPAGDTEVIVSGLTYYYSGYVTSLEGSLYNGVTDVAWSFEARTRTPTLGYDLASFVGTGSGVSVASAASVGTTNGPVLNVSSGTLLNSAFPPDITPATFVATAMTGATAITVGVSASTSEFIVAGGTVTIFLNGTNAAATYSITGAMTTLNFTYGGTYATTPGFPLRVVCTGVTAASSVDLTEGSTRPVYLVYDNSSPVTINHTSTPRLTGLFLTTSATIGAGTIQGGLRSNGGVWASGGTLNIIRETSPGTLDAVAIPRGWLESYRND